MNMQITFEQVKTALSIAKSAYDISQDILLYQENWKALNSRDFAQIHSQLQKSIDRHGQTIKNLSLFTGITVIPCLELSFHNSYNALYYVTQNLPFYVAVEQLTEKGLEEFLSRLAKQLL